MNGDQKKIRAHEGSVVWIEPTDTMKVEDFLKQRVIAVVAMVIRIDQDNQWFHKLLYSIQNILRRKLKYKKLFTGRKEMD